MSASSMPIARSNGETLRVHAQNTTPETSARTIPACA
jgi:hypothetical protein